MYRPKKEPVNQPIVLPKLASLPNLDHIVAAVGQAQSSSGKWVELSWDRPGNGEVLTLGVILRHEGGAPLWTLKEGLHRNAVEIWTYESGDSALIYNLVMTECTGGTATEDSLVAVSLNPAGNRSMASPGAIGGGLLGLQATTHGRLPAFSLNKESGPASFEGDLVDMPIPNLLQSCAMGKMTGKLLVHNNSAAAEMFFDDGNLVHATMDSVTGEDVILEVVGWENGKFYFYRDQKNTERSVQRRMDAVLMEGLTLLDQLRMLSATGLSVDCFINKKNRQLTEADFDRAVTGGAPANVSVQKQLYISFDGCATLSEIINRRALSKKEWVPIFYNLVKGDLISMEAQSVEPDKTSSLSPTPVDRVAIEAIERSFRRSDTGLVSYPHFQYLLEQEFARGQLYRTQFSIIVIEFWRQHQSGPQPLSMPSLKAVFERMETLKRKLDVISHFETLSYSILLPHTDTSAASILAYRLRDLLLASDLPDTPATHLGMACGIAGAPEDCREIGILLSAAKASKQAAQMNSTPIVLFKDLQKVPARTGGAGR